MNSRVSFVPQHLAIFSCLKTLDAGVWANTMIGIDETYLWARLRIATRFCRPNSVEERKGRKNASKLDKHRHEMPSESNDTTRDFDVKWKRDDMQENLYLITIEGPASLVFPVDPPGSQDRVTCDYHTSCSGSSQYFLDITTFDNHAVTSRTISGG
ncbi:hypothetical protein K469DRAFT_349738 [Zopfia rhizophila CBS 207.26]|uniref:Uncharacterized protein n=1 Tax=Zopfia rhizophila CBS 207.26 TaxID=1314779 RepID=A0A6A6DEG1_9PEZI|nr:hypothetical protein K469DRAFT_349738 [Zopfia rhizophila CBS 207.26]